MTLELQSNHVMSINPQSESSFDLFLAMAETTPESMGILARFVNRVSRDRFRRVVKNIDAKVAEYQKSDYLKGCDGTKWERGYGEVTGVPTDCKYPRGFYRRPQSMINQDEERLRAQALQEDREQKIIENRQRAYEEKKQIDSYNIITGTGSRQYDDEHGGIRRVTQDLTARVKLDRFRIRNSQNRFYEVKQPDEAKLNAAIYEGMVRGKESVLIGVPPGNNQRRLKSNGVYDNFEHTRLDKPAPVIENLTLKPPRKNASQIVFG